MKFDIIKSSKIENTQEIYLIHDKSFDCSSTINVDINVAVAYLNLGIDSDDMCVKCLWGFSPRENWKETKLSVPSSDEGKLRLKREYKAGLTWRIDKDRMWEAYFDKSSRWYCIGDPALEKDDKAVKIIKNMIIVINNISELKAIWIQPEFV